MRVVDEYAFREEVLQFHWSGVPSRRSLIAVANMTSNIELIDPRLAFLSVILGRVFCSCGVHA